MENYMSQQTFTFKSKTPSGTSKRIVILIDQNIITIAKWVIVKAETIEPGGFIPENGWILKRKFTAFSLFLQTITTTREDLFSINNIVVKDFLGIPQIQDSSKNKSTITFEMFENIGFSSKGDVFVRTKIDKPNCHLCWFWKNKFCDDINDYFGDSEYPDCVNTLAVYKWDLADTKELLQIALEDCIKREDFERAITIKTKIDE